MTTSADVLIVGGGPAGSTCARELTRAGADVLVVDKAEFPRDKTCAGWITPAVVQELDIDLDDFESSRTLQPVLGFRTGIIGGSIVSTDYGRPVSYGIRRREFDEYLLHRCGARLALGEAVKSIERCGDEWVVNGQYRSRVLVGAGGHFCPVARQFGTPGSGDPLTVFAQEIEFPLTSEQNKRCRADATIPELYFCEDLLGYGWCFRKGNYLNVGLGREDKVSLAEHVRDFREYLIGLGTVPADTPTKFHGHAYILYQHSVRRPVHDGVLLIGDAAGLAYPQSGEGIRPAVESGMLAAEAILAAREDYAANRLRDYQLKLESRFGRRNESIGGGMLGRVPAGIQQWLARKLMSTRWFTRHVLIERWFLHMAEPALERRAPEHAKAGASRDA